jgi:hypothetical protein
MQIPQDRVTRSHPAGITRALYERQPVAFAVPIYRNRRGAIADRNTGYWSGAQKRVKAGEEESKRDKCTHADNANVIANTKEPGHRSFSEALKRSSRRSPRAHMPKAPQAEDHTYTHKRSGEAVVPEIVEVHPLVISIATAAVHCLVSGCANNTHARVFDP